MVCYGYIKLQRNATSSMLPCLVYFSVLYRCTNPLHTRQHVASNICICNNSTPQECALPLYHYFEHVWLCFFCLFVFYYWHWFQADIKPYLYTTNTLLCSTLVYTEVNLIFTLFQLVKVTTLLFNAPWLIIFLLVSLFGTSSLLILTMTTLIMLMRYTWVIAQKCNTKIAKL